MKIYLHHVVDLEAEQAAGFAHVDGYFQEAGRIEKGQGLAYRHFVIDAVNLLDGIVPLEQN